MKYLRHDFTENIYALPRGLRESMVLDELSKLINLQPKSCKDALAVSGVDVKSKLKKTEIAKLICDNNHNLKLRNRLAKMIVVINAREEDDKFVSFDGDFSNSMRDLMNKGKVYIDKYKEKINDVSFVIGQSLSLKSSSNTLNKNLRDYDNFGEVYKPQAGLRYSELQKSDDGKGKALFFGTLSVVGLAIYLSSKL